LSHRTKDEFFAQYVGTGITPPTYIRIDDQNSYAFKSPMTSSDGNNWEWLLGNPGLAFVHDRTVASGSAAGDMSDSGMIFWFLTGLEHPTMSDIRSFLE